MSVSPEIIEKIQKDCIEALTQLVINALASLERQVADKQGDTLLSHSDAIVQRFIQQMNYHFDELMDREIVKQDAVFSFETLSLVQEEELDVMVALEGMVNASRNEHLPVFISFNTRLSSLFPRKRIDESTNPLDPEQVSTAFQEALRPVQIEAKHGLTIYRAFNKEVLKKMDEVLNLGNRLLVDSSVIPSLGMESAQKKEQEKASRSQPRSETNSFGSLEEEIMPEEATDDDAQSELFSVMQNLLHFDEPADQGQKAQAPVDVDVSDFDLDAALAAGGSVTRAKDEGNQDHGRFSRGSSGSESSGSSASSGTGGGTGNQAAPGGGDFPLDAGSGSYGAGGASEGGLPGGMMPAGNYSGGQPGMVPAEEVMIPASMIPGLLANSGVAMSGNGGAGPASAMQSVQLQEGQSVEMVDQAKLMAILTDIQSRLANTPPASGHVPSTLEEVSRVDISASLGEMLQSSSEDENVISAVDRQSSDIINLVTLLYEAIWQDVSVPIPIKELIGRTQVTIIKVALNDTNFFNDENHPARTILNEFASSGIGWTEVEALEQDPLYQKINELVTRIIGYTDDISLFEELIEDFREFKAQETAKTKQLEQNILKAKERNERMDDIYELVSQKIEERILGRELDPFIDDLLHVHFHKFMVMLVIKEGPGSNAWKQAINTIDVLLWTVELKDHKEDRQRLETVNPRLFNNLRKAFRIAGLPGDEITDMLTRLDEVQEASFPPELREQPPANTAETESEADAGDEVAGINDGKVDREVDGKVDGKDGGKDAADAEDDKEATVESSPPEVRFLAAGEDERDPEIGVHAKAESDEASRDDEAIEAPVFAAAEKEPEPEAEAEEELTDDSPYMRQVDELSVGMWLEFAGDTEDNNTRCKLAAKINAIDKFIFVNRQGVKVLEKTKVGLAKELRDGTVQIISDGLLFSRALESVIGNLRENQIEQQTASAYQPDQPEGDESDDETSPALSLLDDDEETPALSLLDESAEDADDDSEEESGEESSEDPEEKDDADDQPALSLLGDDDSDDANPEDPEDSDKT